MTALDPVATSEALAATSPASAAKPSASCGCRGASSKRRLFARGRRNPRG